MDLLSLCFIHTGIRSGGVLGKLCQAQEPNGGQTTPLTVVNLRVLQHSQWSGP